MEVQTSLPPSPQKTNLLKQVQSCELVIEKLSREAKQAEVLAAEVAVAKQELGQKIKLSQELMVKNDSLEGAVDGLELNCSDLKARRFFENCYAGAIPLQIRGKILYSYF